VIERVGIVSIASVAILYRKTNPGEVFLDIKTPGYPLTAFVGMICPIGGNWIGDQAQADLNPLATWRREFEEEFTITTKVASLAETRLLGDDPKEEFYTTPRNLIIPSRTDLIDFTLLKHNLPLRAEPFGDFLVTVPKSVLDRNAPENRRPGYTALHPYWLVEVFEDEWRALVALHQKFGNLSCESQSVITSLPQIIAEGQLTCCGHDVVMREFFQQMGCANAEGYPMLEGITFEHRGMPLDSYDKYRAEYDITRTPFFNENK